MKRPSTDVTINALALLAIIAFGAWFAWATEWVDVWKPTPARGEAARDDHYAIKQIVKRLGATVVSPESLDALPPPGATLVLQSNQWDFMPDRSQRLRDWVERDGGHLVLPSFYATGDDIPWVPIGEKPRPKKKSKPDEEEEEEEYEEDDDELEEEEPTPPQPASSQPRSERFNPKLIGPKNHTKWQ